MAAQQDTSSLYDTNNLQIPSSQVVLVYTEWNPEIIHALRAGAIKILSAYPQVRVVEVCVPGAIEIPYAIAEYHRQKAADAYIALGSVIRGETPHFDFVCQSVITGITHLNISIGSPVIFGILTVNNQTQALERLGGPHGHKGEEAALAALKMISFRNSLKLQP